MREAVRVTGRAALVTFLAVIGFFAVTATQQAGADAVRAKSAVTLDKPIIWPPAFQSAEPEVVPIIWPGG